MYVYVCLCVYICIYTYRYTCMYTSLSIHTYIHIYTYVYIYIYTIIHVYIYIYTRIYTYTSFDIHFVLKVCRSITSIDIYHIYICYNRILLRATAPPALLESPVAGWANNNDNNHNNGIMQHNIS